MKVSHKSSRDIINQIREWKAKESQDSQVFIERRKDEIVDNLIAFLDLPKEFVQAKVNNYCKDDTSQKVLWIIAYPFDDIALESDRKHLLANCNIKNAIDKNMGVRDLIENSLFAGIKQIINNAEMPNDHYSKKSHIASFLALTFAAVATLANTSSEDSKIGILPKILLSFSFWGLALNNLMICLVRQDNLTSKQVDSEIEAILSKKKEQIDSVIGENKILRYDSQPITPNVGRGISYSDQITWSSPASSRSCL